MSLPVTKSYKAPLECGKRHAWAACNSYVMQSCKPGTEKHLSIHNRSNISGDELQNRKPHWVPLLSPRNRNLSLPAVGTSLLKLVKFGQTLPDLFPVE